MPGMREDEIDTPALVIDLDAFEYNLDRMAALLAGGTARLRAHAKTHKSPVIAALQAARGAVGQCVQKVAEAEVLAWGGVRDILVSNEVVGARKLARLAALAPIAEVAVCVDDAAQVAAIEAAARDAGAAARRAGGDRRRRRTLRRGARTGGGGAGAGDRRLAASAFRRLAGLSRQRAASAPAGGARSRDRRRRRRGAAHGRAVAPGRAGLPDRRRRRHRHLRASRRRAASIPSCRPAATASWMPTTRAISTKPAGR